MFSGIFSSRAHVRPRTSARVRPRPPTSVEIEPLVYVDDMNNGGDKPNSEKFMNFMKK